MKMGVWFCVLSAILEATLFAPRSLSLSEDATALLELKSALNDSRNVLPDWNSSNECHCNWTGVYCHDQDQRVRSINLPFLQLRGFISPSIGRLQGLQRLALHENMLHGNIPDEIGNCSELRALYLRANFLEGGIPSGLGSLSHLSVLDLSSNSLKGAIPPSLGGLRYLSSLNLSFNFFSGEIPNIGAILKFGNSSFEGNSNLCGQQVQKPCSSSQGFPVVLPHEEIDNPDVPSIKHSAHYIKGLIIGAMSTMVLLILILLTFLWICIKSKKKRALSKYKQVKKQVHHELSTKLITFHGDLPYPSCEIVEKLESLDEEDVVGSGGFGTVYRMVMNDCGTFAVKRIDRSSGGLEKIFERELEILGSIKHINLVNLRGYCRLPTSKLLIYDYLAMGSLDDILHGNERQEKFLNWTARLKIALGSARGLAYLHHDCYPKIVHRDIKSSNILLDEKLEPRVSDFGLAKLVVDEDAHVTTVVAGTFGYLAPGKHVPSLHLHEKSNVYLQDCVLRRIDGLNKSISRHNLAPKSRNNRYLEYLQSGRATEKSDVYSFGVLLLELVTGKRPTDPCFVNKGLNVVGWMNTLLKDNHLEEVVDRRCRDAGLDAVEAILDVAMRCTTAIADERPSMNQVLQFLEQEVMSPCLSDFYDSHSDRT